MAILKQADDIQIEAFLQLFGDDVSAAIQSIQSLAAKTHAHAKPVLPTNKKKIISVRSLTKEYTTGRTKLQALQDVSLDIYEGEFVAITGSSGSGKSTLLQLMGGLEKPSSGTVTVDGVEFGSMSDRELSRFRGQMIGFVFQFFYLQPFLSLNKNIEVPGMFAHSKREARMERVKELAEAVGLNERLNHLPKELSGGQIQRAAIARALLNNPRVLLADEPTGNLDSTNGTTIINLFEKIRQQYGTTIVVVTHDYKIASRADRQINLRDGLII